MESKDSISEGGAKPRRVIKRYSNRKLYDTKDSRYVTLLQIAEMVRGDEEVQIIDNNSKEDLTEVTLAQIIYEEQKANSRNVPLQTLKELLSGLREGPIGRLIPGAKDAAEPDADESEDERMSTADDKDRKGEKASFVGQAKTRFEDFQREVDERVKAALPSFLPWQQLENEVKRLAARVEALEAELARRDKS